MEWFFSICWRQCLTPWMFTCILSNSTKSLSREAWTIKFMTCRIYNKSPSHFSFDTGTVSNLKNRGKYVYSFGRMKSSFSQGKTSLLERWIAFKTVFFQELWKYFNNSLIIHFFSIILKQTWLFLCPMWQFLILERNLIGQILIMC